jgi:hypothetical protein
VITTSAEAEADEWSFRTRHVYWPVSELVPYVINNVPLAKSVNFFRNAANKFKLFTLIEIEENWACIVNVPRSTGVSSLNHKIVGLGSPT